jgi:hypothetical protein
MLPRLPACAPFGFGPRSFDSGSAVSFGKIGFSLAFAQDDGAFFRSVGFEALTILGSVAGRFFFAVAAFEEEGERADDGDGEDRGGDAEHEGFQVDAGGLRGGGFGFGGGAAGVDRFHGGAGWLDGDGGRMKSGGVDGVDGGGDVKGGHGVIGLEGDGGLRRGLIDRFQTIL